MLLGTYLRNNLNSFIRFSGQRSFVEMYNIYCIVYLEWLKLLNLNTYTTLKIYWVSNFVSTNKNPTDKISSEKEENNCIILL